MVQPDLEIVFPNTIEIIVELNSTSLSHTFSPLRTSDGGQYTCTATVNIPEVGIADLKNSATENITVASEECIIIITSDVMYIIMYIYIVHV